MIDTRSNRVTRVDWRPAGQGNQGDYNRPDYNRPSSGQFQSGRYEIQLVATNRMLAWAPIAPWCRRIRATTAIRGWVLEDAGNGLGSLHQVCRYSERVMTVSGGGSGSSIVLARQRRGSNDQLWEIRSGPDNDYYLISKRGLALDSPSSARYDGGRMRVYNRNGEANQRFRLNPVAGGRDDNYDRRRQGNPPYDRRPGDYDQRPGYGGSGSMTWSGRVDGTVELIIQGNYVRENNIDGQPVYNSRSDSARNSRMPTSGSASANCEVEAASKSSNSLHRTTRFSAIIRIRDEQGGADDCEIQVNWN
ncbi:MAG: RICIN domain-containing protein [Acidobacteria bacterium]|nr:RICIN domain-containing protein [Acidobacteriota bacterium]